MNIVSRWFRETFTVGSTGSTHKSDVVTPGRRTTGNLSEETKSIRDRFLSAEDDPNESLTKFQKRMQSSGGPK